MRVVTINGKKFIKVLEKRGTCMCKSIKFYNRELIGTICADCKSTVVYAHVSQYVLKLIG
jgi:hypothetical protein